MGRKYAMLKLKVLISTVLRNYKITSNLTEKDYKLQVDIILKRSDGFRIQIEPRIKTKSAWVKSIIYRHKTLLISPEINIKTPKSIFKKLKCTKKYDHFFYLIDLTYEQLRIVGIRFMKLVKYSMYNI